jgi:hypothetical protein
MAKMVLLLGEMGLAVPPASGLPPRRRTLTAFELFAAYADKGTKSPVSLIRIGFQRTLSCLRA